MPGRLCFNDRWFQFTGFFFTQSTAEGQRCRGSLRSLFFSRRVRRRGRDAEARFARFFFHAESGGGAEMQRLASLASFFTQSPAEGQSGRGSLRSLLFAYRFSQRQALQLCPSAGLCVKKNVYLENQSARLLNTEHKLSHFRFIVVQKRINSFHLRIEYDLQSTTLQFYRSMHFSIFNREDF